MAVTVTAKRAKPIPPRIESVTITMDPDTARLVCFVIGRVGVARYLDMVDATVVPPGVPSAWSYADVGSPLGAVYAGLDKVLS